MPILQILLGLLAILVAWLFFHRSRLLFAFNEFMRRRVFNDHVVLFQGRRMAALLILLGIIALFSGVESVVNVQPIKPNIAAEMLQQAQDDFRMGRYAKTVNRCKELVRSDPQNVDAWELLANAWWALGEKDRATKAVESILRINPDHPIKSTSLGEYARNRRQ